MVKIQGNNCELINALFWFWIDTYNNIRPIIYIYTTALKSSFIFWCAQLVTFISFFNVTFATFHAGTCRDWTHDLSAASSMFLPIENSRQIVITDQDGSTFQLFNQWHKF